MKKIILIALVLFCILAILHGIDVKNKERLTTLENEVQKPVTRSNNKNVILGAAFTPANFPGSSPDDVKDFFRLADELGNTVILIGEWKDGIDPKNITIVRDLTHARGMKFHYHISPISLDRERKYPAIPKSVDGDSFTDAKVREAFVAYALKMASLEPDLLGLGTEVNFLAKNPSEFNAYVTMVKEAYDAVKKKYPDQTMTISFHWDSLRKDDPKTMLAQFKGSLDIYSFTTYPSFSHRDPDDLPRDYYTSIRMFLPTERIGFSEIGWFSKGKSSEDVQAKYYGQLAELMRETKPEYALLGLLHDVKVFGGELDMLNSVGVRNRDGSPKKSWDIILNLNF